MARAANWNDGHQTWCHEDPDWIFASYGTARGPRVRHLPGAHDGSRTAYRLCAVGAKYPQFTVYAAFAFAASSPDGTKVQFMSNMLGSVDEYLVVARAPQPPQNLAAEIRDGKDRPPVDPAAVPSGDRQAIWSTSVARAGRTGRRLDGTRREHERRDWIR